MAVNFWYMAPMIDKVSAVTVRVRNMKASVQFYRDVLGMEVAFGGEGLGTAHFHVAYVDKVWVPLGKREFAPTSRRTLPGANVIFKRANPLCRSCAPPNDPSGLFLPIRNPAPSPQGISLRRPLILPTSISIRNSRAAISIRMYCRFKPLLDVASRAFARKHSEFWRILDGNPSVVFINPDVPARTVKVIFWQRWNDASAAKTVVK